MVSCLQVSEKELDSLILSTFLEVSVMLCDEINTLTLY